MELHVPSFPAGYRSILSAIANRGEYAEPRGEETIELLGATIVIEDTQFTLPTGMGRKIGTALADEEALQLIAGVYRPERLKMPAQFTADDKLEGYGTLARAGIERSVQYLMDDPDTRRACVNLAHTGGDSGYPCLTSLGWALRGDRLWAFSNWRSNDAWLGMPYDVHKVAALQHTIAYVLGVVPGPLVHHVRSLHIYASDIDRIDGLESIVTSRSILRPTLRIDAPTWRAARYRALEMIGLPS